MLLALLHLVEYTGTIKVDGVDLATIPRSVIRQRCFITIPQDAFLMPHATLRVNIDSSQSLSDGVLVEVLKKVRLWKHLSAHHPGEDAVAVLDAELASLPVLSGGQTQLMSLARAITKREYLHGEEAYRDTMTNSRPILLLDEATSSLDPRTEEIIHNVINEEFVAKGYTTIMVTHKPEIEATRMREGDIFVWMKDGKVEKLTRIGEDLGQV